ncbi:NUDIX hydrolase [Thermodesulfobacteriota bacterium]
MNEWIEWVKQIKAITQIGISYTKDEYDSERYEQLSRIAHQMIAKLADAPLNKVDNFFIPDKGYATPKVDLRDGIIRENKILLARERSDGKWTLPGGWADTCESASEGIIREVFEETGYEIEIDRLIAIRDRSLHPYKPQYPDHIYKMFFLCDLVGGESKTNLEISEIDFFTRDELPPLSEGRVLSQDIDIVFDYYKNGNNIPLCD